MTSSLSNAGFKEHMIPISPCPTDPLLDDHHIYTLRYQHPNSTKEPLLLLHGHPQNLYIWHRLGPALTKSAQRDIVLTDLRGHGKSGIPKVRNLNASKGDKIPKEEVLRARYSKRQMARDMIEVMKSFGYDKFAVVGHDRGGRVAHRMALDHKDIITRVMTMDIVPTKDLYDGTNSFFATAYWHWFFLIQPYPFPEELLIQNPSLYLNKMVNRFNDSEGKVFPKEILQTYLNQLSNHQHIHATCEDYRCSAPSGFDLELDEADRKAGRKVEMPLRALWGEKGVNQIMFGEKCTDLWKNVCEQASGKAYNCGHYMPEEIPNEMEAEILSFFE